MMSGDELDKNPEQPHMGNSAHQLGFRNLTPYLDDGLVGQRDRCVEDFIWSMDDSRHVSMRAETITY